MGQNDISIDIEKVAAQSPQARSINLPEPVIDERRPQLTTASKYSFQDAKVVGYDGHTGTKASLGCMYDRLWSFGALFRWARHFIPVAALLAIPLTLYATKYRNYKADGVHLLGLFVWLEVLWGSLWVSKLIAMLLPTIYVFVSGIVNSGVRKYHPVLRMIETVVSLFFWTIIAGTTVVPVCMAFDAGLDAPNWVLVLRRVCVASIAVSAMVLVQRLIIQIINITYSEKQFTGRIKNSKRHIAMLDALYIQSTTRYPPFCPEFAQEDYTILTGIVDKSQSSPGKLLENVRMAGREVAQAFGQMASDITGASLFNTKAAHTIVTEALEAKTSSEALGRRLWKSFAERGATAINQQDLEHAFSPENQKDADELFQMLDVDQNGDVSLEEMIFMVIHIGQERIDIWKSAHDLKAAVRVLDRFLQVFVLVGVALVYAAFFSESFSSYLATIGTQLAAVSFAISGTVQEFLGSCIFIFVKHPFDIGDRVRIGDQDLIVEKISLLYSVFRTVACNKTVQIPNINLNSQVVENVSRSGAMKERITLEISAETSFEDIEHFKEDIQARLKLPENRRDFKEDIDVELVSIGDMSKMELSIEAEHKSSWINERIRRVRRNKLMTSVISSFRAVPIYGPGGGYAALGDESRPTYQVTVSDAEAVEARRIFNEHKASQKLYAKPPAPVQTDAGVTSALETSQQVGLTHRRES